jgi:hypothetical protein
VHTYRIKEAAKYIEIDVKDHIIVKFEAGKYYGFADDGANVVIECYLFCFNDFFVILFFSDKYFNDEIIIYFTSS